MKLRDADDTSLWFQISDGIARSTKARAVLTITPLPRTHKSTIFKTTIGDLQLSTIHLAQEHGNAKITSLATIYSLGLE